MDTNSEKNFSNEFCTQIHTIDKVVQKNQNRAKHFKTRIYNNKMAAKNLVS